MERHHRTKVLPEEASQHGDKREGKQLPISRYFHDHHRAYEEDKQAHVIGVRRFTEIGACACRDRDRKPTRVFREDSIRTPD